jgi:hypothetical protein
MHVRKQVGDWVWHNMRKLKINNQRTNTEVLGWKKIKKKKRQKEKPTYKCI